MWSQCQTCGSYTSVPAARWRVFVVAGRSRRVVGLGKDRRLWPLTDPPVASMRRGRAGGVCGSWLQRRFCFLSWGAGSDRGADAQRSPQPTPRPSRQTVVQQQLQDPKITAQRKTYLSQVEQRRQELRAKVDRDRQLRPSSTPVPTPAGARPTVITVPHRTAGSGEIFEGGPPPVSSQSFQLINSWRKLSTDPAVLVWAGWTTPERTQGAVVVIVNRSSGATSGESYLTPAKSGPVRIVDAVGERLTLTSESGTIFYFDVPSRQFVKP